MLLCFIVASSKRLSLKKFLKLNFTGKGRNIFKNKSQFQFFTCIFILILIVIPYFGLKFITKRWYLWHPHQFVIKQKLMGDPLACCNKFFQITYN